MENLKRHHDLYGDILFRSLEYHRVSVLFIKSLKYCQRSNFPYDFLIAKLSNNKMNMQSFSKVPDQVGYLLLHESGATISSSGELENDEKTAETIYNLVTVTDKLDPAAFPGEGFNKISICYKDFCYVICMSNKKIHVVKRKMTVGLNSSTAAAAEPHLIDLQVPVNNSINA